MHWFLFLLFLKILCESFVFTLLFFQALQKITQILIIFFCKSPKLKFHYTQKNWILWSKMPLILIKKKMMIWLLLHWILKKSKRINLMLMLICCWSKVTSETNRCVLIWWHDFMNSWLRIPSCQTEYTKHSSSRRFISALIRVHRYYVVLLLCHRTVKNHHEIIHLPIQGTVTIY